MKEDEVFKLADLHLGKKYNRANAKALCDEVFNEGVRRGADMLRSSILDATMVDAGDAVVPRWVLAQAERIAHYMDTYHPGQWAVGGIQKREKSE